MSYNGVLWMTTHDGKMKGINSIGTCCTNNKFCLERMKNGDSVCSHCYANTYMKMRKSLRVHLEENGDILSTREISGNELPLTNSKIFRFESFGDIHNATHLKNYIKICEANKGTNFALWTKNISILRSVFTDEHVSKPDNMIIIVSSPMLNKPIQIDRKKYWFVDHVFTVYDKHYIADNDMEINCGARNCLGCQRCYHKNTEFYINEKLK